MTTFLILAASTALLSLENNFVNISFSPDGMMRIDGMRSSFYLGVTPAMAKWRSDGYGRIASPVIQSVDLKVAYA